MWRHPLGQALQVEFALHAIAFPFDDDGVGVVQQPIEQSRRQSTVVIKDLGPVLKGLIGGNQGGALLIADADHLEE